MDTTDSSFVSTDENAKDNGSTSERFKPHQLIDGEWLELHHHCETSKKLEELSTPNYKDFRHPSFRICKCLIAVAARAQRNALEELVENQKHKPKDRLCYECKSIVNIVERPNSGFCSDECADKSKNRNAPPPAPVDHFKMSGAEADMTEEIFKQTWNSEENVVKDMNNDQLQDHIHKLAEITRIAKIRWKCAYLAMSKRLEEADDDERRRIRQRDQAYKIDTTKVAAKKRASRADSDSIPGLSKQEKAILKLMDQFKWTREKAIKFLDNMGDDE